LRAWLFLLLVKWNELVKFFLTFFTTGARLDANGAGDGSDNITKAAHFLFLGCRIGREMFTAKPIRETMVTGAA